MQKVRKEDKYATDFDSFVFFYNNIWLDLFCIFEILLHTFDY